jgi:hypothetical protein
MVKRGDIAEKTCFPTPESGPFIFENPAVPLLPDVPACQCNYFSEIWTFKDFPGMYKILLN